MPDSIFIESGIQFQFPADWLVFKYDEHRFYRYLSGSGLKGVDFIAIRDNELILIEIKNYRERIEKELYSPVAVLIEKPDLYKDKFVRKFEDTFRLLGIIEQYYQRQWWYRNVFQLLKKYLPKKWLFKMEVFFWSKAITLLKQNHQVTLLLWLEVPPELSAEKVQHIHSYFQAVMQAQLPDGMTLYLTHSKISYAKINSRFI